MWTLGDCIDKRRTAGVCARSSVYVMARSLVFCGGVFLTVGGSLFLTLLPTFGLLCLASI